MQQPAIRILNSHRIMSISTVRPDGWPQTTVVGYANQGFDLFFLIFRASQKFANIQHDERISVAIAAEPPDLSELQAVYAGAHAKEITDPAERATAWRLLMARHSNLAGFKIPNSDDAVFMHAMCKYVSVLDFTQGPGHREEFTVDDNGAVTQIGVADEKWGQTTAAGHSNGADSQ